MSSVDEEMADFDKGEQTARALGVFFGMVGLNLILVGIALILRRVTRPKENTPNNSVELKTGKYNRKESNANADIEKALSSTHNGESTKQLKMAAKAQEASAQEHHDNGGFVDVDLENETGATTEAVYEKPTKSEAANKENSYSQLESSANARVKSSDPSGDYETFQSDSQSKTENPEAAVCY